MLSNSWFFLFLSRALVRRRENKKRWTLVLPTGSRQGPSQPYQLSARAP